MEVQVVPEHDYCVTPMTSVMSDELASENEALKRKVQELQNQLETLQLQSRFGLQRLAGSDEDIRFYTRFASYKHFQAFWRLVEPAVKTKMVRITSANAASANSNEPTQLRATSTQMCREDVQQTRSIARLRVHVERCIRRVKENKLFDKVIPLSVCGSTDQLFSVACFPVNY
ncbi:hypothetical protein ABVT39_021615 [Epinephelus coioides]